MFDRLSGVCSMATALARFVALSLIVFLAAFLVACGGGSSHNSISVPPPSGGTPPPFQIPETGISPFNFGMQCGIGDPADCQGPGGSVPIVWPDRQAQPGCLRLHDSGTYWAQLNPNQSGPNQYDWTNLDNWLDLIATEQPRCVIEVFTWTPCWDATTGTCGIDPTAPTGTNGVPNDLNAGGSPTFTAFVTAFANHCSPAGNCVSKYIKYYEMWNEWDLVFHWTGTMEQVYQMVAPAAKAIKSIITDATILTPSATPDAMGAASNTGLGWQADFANWLALEDANPPHISDWIAWHVYLTNTSTTTNTPETQWGNYVRNPTTVMGFLDIQSANPNWAKTPWANTETNFGGNNLNYSCPTTEYSASDCAGQIVRWQLIQASNGAASVDWYKWNETIGAIPQYETAYYYMQKYMIGGTFAAPCSFTAANGASTWTCNFAESGGTQALWVWTPNEAGTTFTVPSGYVDYLDLTGAKTAVSAGQTISISVEPILLEQ